MLLVLDSNILFTYFWKDSVLKHIKSSDAVLVAPEFSLSEIKKHGAELMEKSSLSEAEFKKLREELALKVSFVPLSEYSSHFKEVLSKVKHIPKEQLIAFLKDIDFLALALKLDCHLWSNDKLLKKLFADKVLTTEQIIGILEPSKDS